MKLYNILPNLQVELNRVTPRAMKFYRENNFFEERMTQSGEYIDFLVNEDFVFDWCNIIFVIKDEQKQLLKEKILDVDFEVVFEAHWDFFIKLNPPLRKLINTLRSSGDSTQTTTLSKE